MFLSFKVLVCSYYIADQSLRQDLPPDCLTDPHLAVTVVVQTSVCLVNVTLYIIQVIPFDSVCLTQIVGSFSPQLLS